MARQQRDLPRHHPQLRPPRPPRRRRKAPRDLLVASPQIEIDPLAGGILEHQHRRSIRLRGQCRPQCPRNTQRIPGGKATLALPKTRPGRYRVAASYSGDATVLPGTARPVRLTVTRR